MDVLYAEQALHGVGIAASLWALEVLLSARVLFEKLRALSLLAAGQAVEDLILELYDVAGAPSELPAECFQEALEAEERLLGSLQETWGDREAMQLVVQLYKETRPQWALALFLLGRAAHDLSLIINAGRPVQEEGFLKDLGFEQVGDSGLWGRVTVIDTDIKPAARIPKYAKTLRSYCQHELVQPLLSCMKAGGTLYDGLDSVEAFQLKSQDVQGLGFSGSCRLLTS